jgi:hypothetical protein
MQFVDLKTQQKRIRVELDRRIAAVLDHGHFIMGPEVFELEAKLAQYVGVKHAVSCASGTDALLMALMATGVGPGDAVFTTPFSFFATAEVVSMLGATPVFVDIDPRTYNLNPEALEAVASKFCGKSAPPYPLFRSKMHRNLTPKPVIAVDLFGVAVEYDRINQVAEEFGVTVVEDAAQSFGALNRGRKAGSLAEVACTSFYPAKHWVPKGMAACVLPMMMPPPNCLNPSEFMAWAASNTTMSESASTAASTRFRRRYYWPNSTFFLKRSKRGKKWQRLIPGCWRGALVSNCRWSKGGSRVSGLSKACWRKATPAPKPPNSGCQLQVSPPPSTTPSRCICRRHSKISGIGQAIFRSAKTVPQEYSAYRCIHT